MGNESIEAKLVKLLIEKKLTITTAESCTGGMISSTIVNVPGASWVINEAYVTYANEAKMKLVGVKKETLESYGAVSEQVVIEMVTGAMKNANADVAIAVSGIAGPDGGTAEKPVGTVWAAFACLDKVETKRFNFKGDRYEVRKQTTEAVLEYIYNLLNQY